MALSQISCGFAGGNASAGANWLCKSLIYKHLDKRVTGGEASGA
jgi:hypothetical protein